MNDPEFGLCPRCGRNDGCFNIGREQLLCFCLWCAGENLLTVPLRLGETKWDAILRAIEADPKRRYPINKFIQKAKIRFSKFCKNQIWLVLAAIVLLLQLLSRD